MADCAKILLLGKTGVGKSSFINYFLGQPVAETGYGEPVTKDFFVPYMYTRGRYPIEVVDTKGLEALGAAEQKQRIIQEIQRRNNSEDVYDWFHTIFYCVSLDNPRFEEFEAEFIRELRRDLSQHIHVIITHCDNKPAGKREAMRDTICRALGDIENLQIFEVTSVEMKKRSGAVHPQGREIISERVFELLVDDIADRLSRQYAEHLHRAQIQTIRSNIARLRDFIRREVNLLSLSTGMDRLEQKNAQVSRQIEDGIAAAAETAGTRLASVLRPACVLYSTYWSVLHSDGNLPSFVRQDLTEFRETCGDIGMDDDELLQYIAPRTAHTIDQDPDTMSFWELLGNVFNGVLDMLWIQPNLLKAVDQIENRMLAEIPSEDELRRRAYDGIVAYLIRNQTEAVCL